ncbi:MAG: alpha/beta fold hydrolase [Gemmatimonadales bacterium]
MPQAPIEFTIYPDQCDTWGHLNQAAFLQFFERARWEHLARGPGMEIFRAAGVWPAVRRATVDYHAQVLPGDVLRFTQTLPALGRTSFTMKQAAVRAKDGVTVATAEVVFVCVDPAGSPTPLPDQVRSALSMPTDGVTRRTINGVTVALEERGSGPAILMIHGYPLARTLWRHGVDHLPGWRRIAPDLRGMGESSLPDGPASISDYADDMIGVLDALEVKRAVVCGLSMGGYVAFDLVRRHRDRVAGLILISTRAEADTGDARRGRDESAARAAAEGAVAIADSMLSRLFAPDSLTRIPGTVAEVRSGILAMPVPGILAALIALRDRPDSRPLLPTLGNIPVLVIAGAADVITPPQGMHAMAQAIPGAGYVVVPGAGHLAPLEQPDVTTDTIARFLRKLP